MTAIRQPAAQIYVASRASLSARPAMWREHRAAGYPITSTWIDEAEAGQTACLTELWGRIEREVSTATALIFYAEPEDFPLKGAYIEVGIAMAVGIPIGVVAPGVNLEAPSYRPVGSWVRHPNVRLFPTVLAALEAASNGTLASMVAAAEKPYLWYHGSGSDPEVYRGGYKTRQEAIDDGRTEYGGETFSIIEAQKGAFSVPDADDLMGEWLDRWSDDDFGAEDNAEFGGPPEAVKAAERDLDHLLDAWARRHAGIMPAPWSFAHTRNAETFTSAEDLAE